MCTKQVAGLEHVQEKQLQEDNKKKQGPLAEKGWGVEGMWDPLSLDLCCVAQRGLLRTLNFSSKAGRSY